MIEFNINGETYTEKEFQKDIVRMFDSLRTRDYEGESRCCCIYVKCKTCPLRDICIKREGFKYYSFETIEKVYRWAKAYPVKTNRDKLEEVFGVKVVKCFITNGKEKTREYKFSNEENKIIKLFSLSLEDTSFSEWLDDEYKEDKNND